MARRKRGGFTVNTKLPNTKKTRWLLGVGRDGDVQKFVTKDIFKRLIPYIPKLSGALRARARVETNTAISVRSVYARTQFFGVTEDGKPFDYGMAGGAKAGSHWDRRLIADEGKAIVADANRYVRSRGK